MSGDAFVDTNVWLYALVLEPGEDAKHACAKQLVAGLGPLHGQSASHRAAG
jgi:predicted nucleic acid-binding protein